MCKRRSDATPHPHHSSPFPTGALIAEDPSSFPPALPEVPEAGVPEATSEPRLAKSKYKSKKARQLAMAAGAQEQEEVPPPRDTSSPDEEPDFSGGADILSL